MVRGIILLSALTITACLDGPDAHDDALDQIVYTRTTVRRDHDGTQRVTRTPITAEQQALEMAQARLDRMNRLAGRSVADAAATADCGNGLATKLFDQDDFTGNELCLIGAGVEVLGDDCRRTLAVPSASLLCTSTWDHAIRSAWTGAAPVMLDGAGEPASACRERLPAFDARAASTGCMAVAVELTVGATER
jgi:hypothetical protein